MRGPSTFEDLVAVIKLCYGTAKMDGQFTKDEFDTIITGLKAQYDFEGRADLLNEYLDDAEKMSYEEALERISRFDADEKQFTSDMLFCVIAADGKLSPDEEEFYRQMLTEYDLPMFSGADKVDTNNEKEVEHEEEVDEHDAIIPAYIIVNFFGIASVQQSENEDWRSLEEDLISWLGCDGGVQVVRFTPRLNAISEELHLRGCHLVFLMARRGYGDRTVGDNAPATILYGSGEMLYGNIAFALETDRDYKVDGFRSRKLLNEAFAVINEAIGGLMRTED